MPPTRTKDSAVTEPIIQMQAVNKWYGQFHVLRDIHLDVAVSYTHLTLPTKA